MKISFLSFRVSSFDLKMKNIVLHIHSSNIDSVNERKTSRVSKSSVNHILLSFLQNLMIFRIVRKNSENF